MTNIDPSELIMSDYRARVLIQNCHHLLWRKFRGSPLWSLVSQITGHGSGYSIAICKSAGFDPYQPMNGKPLKPFCDTSSGVTPSTKVNDSRCDTAT